METKVLGLREQRDGEGCLGGRRRGRVNGINDGDKGWSGEEDRGWRRKEERWR
jgi:hypothetical protein